MAADLYVGVFAAGVQPRGSPEAPLAEIEADAGSPPAIAVLPIEEPGPADQHPCLGRGIAEELIVSLSGWRNFPVVSPASSLLTRDPTLDYRDRLGSETVLDGIKRLALL